uniref:cysteine peptidase family C39 domain-containing protein n=1 Tax=Glaesserella sp. TaxID=2094731 RepID=UPI00359FF952
MEKQKDLGLVALKILAQYHNIAINTEEIKHKFDLESNGLSLTSWLLAAKELELKAKSTKKSIDRLPFINLPALIWRDDGKHFLLVKIDTEHQRYLTFDIERDEARVFSQEDFKQLYQGTLILVTSRASIIGQLAKFDFTWFIPAVIKYRKIFIETLVVSVFLQIFALITPLFFQVVMDKVLVHRGFSTLNIITAALAVVVIFEIVLSGLRTYIFSHST